MATRRTREPLPLFSSVRERRLWIWTLLLVVAIYSTLGPASTLVVGLVEREIFGWIFGSAFLLFWLAILTQGLKVRPGGIELGVWLGVLTVYAMVLVRLGIPERSHLFEYGVVAVFIFEALNERLGQGRRVPYPVLLALVAASLIGAIDECIQGILPSRVFSWYDMAFNVLAAAMGIFASGALGWARRRTAGAVIDS